MPVQRIPRYKMLLENLLKYTTPNTTEYTDVTVALTLVSQAAAHNNEMIRKYAWCLPVFIRPPHRYA
jgi:hypothetical protein